MKFLTLRSWWVASAVLFTPAIGSAQSPGIVLKVGDVLSTGERVQDIRDALIGDDGSVLALVETDLADLTQDLVLLRDGVIVLREGSPLSEPAGTTLDDWEGLSMNALGDLGMVVRLSSPVAFLERGAYWNGVKVAVKDQVIESPHLGTGTEWETVHAVKLNSSRTMFLVGDVSNPALPRVRERALVRYQLDSAGNILDTTVLATEGMTLAGLLLSGASCLGANDGVLAVNERGDTFTFIAQDTLQALVINMQTIVARTGAPSPVAGKNWREGGFSLSRVALNDFGEYAFTGSIGVPGALDGYLIVKNGQKFVQALDVLPAVGTVGNASTAPLYLANSGDLYWHVRGSAGDALMRNLQVVVQAQSTVVGGQLVTAVAGGENAFHASRDGRFWVGVVQLQGVGDALLKTDFGLAVPEPGCFVVNPGVLRKVGGEARAGVSLTLEMDGGQASGVTPVLFFCSSPAVPGSPCGVIAPVGEILVDITTEVATRVGPAWTGTPTSFTINLPAQMSLVGQEFFSQGVFWDMAGTPRVPRLQLTNGLRLQIGPP